MNHNVVNQNSKSYNQNLNLNSNANLVEIPEVKMTESTNVYNTINNSMGYHTKSNLNQTNNQVGSKMESNSSSININKINGNNKIEEYECE